VHAPTGWRIGPDHYRRTGQADPAAPAPAGIVEDLAAFDAPGFRADAVAPAVRDFYERTSDFDLHVTPDWSRAWLPAYRLFRHAARAMGQLDFPIEPVAVDSRFDAARDGRGRLWLRGYESERVMYQSRVEVDRRHGYPYMAIEFPTPLGTIVSRSRLVNAGAGVDVLTTGAPERPTGSGIWLRVRGREIRTAMDDAIRVRPAGVDVTAEHVFRLCGSRFVTLHYRLQRRREQPGAAPRQPA
jgi:hypothetical protein